MICHAGTVVAGVICYAGMASTRVEVFLSLRVVHHALP